MENNVIYHGTAGLHWKWGQGKSDDAASSKAKKKTDTAVALKQLTTSKEALGVASTLATAAKGSHDKKMSSAAVKASKKEAKTMSDDELAAKVRRMGLEEQYSKLSAAQKDQGRDAVASFLSATTTALNVASAAISVAVVLKQLSAKAPT